MQIMGHSCGLSLAYLYLALEFKKKPTLHMILSEVVGVLSTPGEVNEAVMTCKAVSEKTREAF